MDHQKLNFTADSLSADMDRNYSKEEGKIRGRNRIQNIMNKGIDERYFYLN